MNRYTVIGLYEENQQIFSEHVTTNTAKSALFEVAKQRPDATLICATEGWLQEDKEIVFVGQYAVDADTIISQSEAVNS